MFSLYLSFTNYSLLSAPKWVGLANYHRLFTSDPRYIHSLEVTAQYVVVSVPVKLAAGSYTLKVRATSNAGDIQPIEPRWNPAGYLRNVVETVRVTAG